MVVTKAGFGAQAKLLGKWAKRELSLQIRSLQVSGLSRSEIRRLRILTKWLRAANDLYDARSEKAAAKQRKQMLRLLSSRLSSARDAVVLEKCLTKMSPNLPAAEVERVQKLMLEQSEQSPVDLPTLEEIQVILSDLKEHWPVQTKSRHRISPAKEHCIAHAKACLKTKDSELWHDWRKWVKWTHFQTILLNQIYRTQGVEDWSAYSRLERKLGRLHDWSLLREFAEEAEAAVLSERIDKSSRKLRVECLKLARELGWLRAKKLKTKID